MHSHPVVGSRGDDDWSAATKDVKISARFTKLEGTLAKQEIAMENVQKSLDALLARHQNDDDAGS